MNKRIPTALRVASSLIWAVTPEYLEVVYDVAAGLTDPTAVAAELGRPLQNARKVTVRDGVAIIPVQSVIFRRASLIDDISGDSASVQTIATDFQTAMADPAIKSIVLDIDSPGGEVNGIAELAGMIYAARGVKPVKAYVGYQAGSAAYWLACAAQEIRLHKSASVGSIGCMAIVNLLKDPSKKKFISSQTPDKNAPADTERGADLIQREIDACAQMFLEDVATFRGMSVDSVLANFGYDGKVGAMVMGADAVNAGMADGLGTFEGLIAELQQTGKPEALTGAYAVNDEMVTALADQMRVAVSDTNTKESEDMNKELVNKMLAGLSDAEKAEVMASLGGTPAVTAAATGQQQAGESQQATAPAGTAAVAEGTQAAAVAAPVAQPAAQGGVDIAALQAQLANEKKLRITSDCNAFITSMKVAGKIAPAEESDVRKLYTMLADQADTTALNQYTASIQARVANPMLSETVASNQQLQVLGNGAGDTRTEAEKEADLVNTMLAYTADGQKAATDLQAGKTSKAALQSAMKQFAVNQ
jgi:ClpP class serine protease